MDFDFYNEWEHIGTIKIGKSLSKKIVRLESISHMELVDSKFPTGHTDEDEKIQRYSIGEQKYSFAKEISDILSDECYKFITKSENSDTKKEDSDVMNNPQVLVKLLTLLISDNATHFILG